MRFSTLLLCLFCTACTASKVDERTKFALAAIQDNVVSTDFSALVEITSTSIKELSNTGSNVNKEKLLAIHYSARVLESFLGDKVDTIVFVEYAEKSEGLDNLSKGKLIVSLCKKSDGTYYLPDIGYELPPETALLDEARKIKMHIIRKEISLHRADKNYACTNSTL